MRLAGDLAFHLRDYEAPLDTGNILWQVALNYYRNAQSSDGLRSLETH